MDCEKCKYWENSECNYFSLSANDAPPCELAEYDFGEKGELRLNGQLYSQST